VMMNCPCCGANLRKLFKTYREGLDFRERYILDRRFFSSGDKVPLRTLGATLGISGQRVEQIEKRAMEKLADLLVAD